MKQRSAADFLVRTVLDQAFRALALSDPTRAFAEYDLSEEEQDILRSRDHRLLRLLGDAVAPGEKCAGSRPQAVPPEPVDPAPPSLPEVKLLLRLTPRAVPSPESEPKVSYEATLQPWPHDADPPTDPGTGETATDPGRAAAGEVVWCIRIAPNVVGATDAGLTVAYSASIHPLQGDLNADQPPPGAPAPGLASPPWNHHVASSAASAAARAVEAAEPSRRHVKLLDLIHALQTGDEGG